MAQLSSDLKDVETKNPLSFSGDSHPVAYGLDLSNFIDDFQGIKSLMDFQRGVMAL